MVLKITQSYTYKIVYQNRLVIVHKKVSKIVFLILEAESKKWSKKFK